MPHVAIDVRPAAATATAPSIQMYIPLFDQSALDRCVRGSSDVAVDLVVGSLEIAGQVEGRVVVLR
jgi:hypothetical protein